MTAAGSVNRQADRPLSGMTLPELRRRLAHALKYDKEEMADGTLAELAYRGVDPETAVTR